MPVLKIIKVGAIVSKQRILKFASPIFKFVRYSAILNFSVEGLSERVTIAKNVTGIANKYKRNGNCQLNMANIPPITGSVPLANCPKAVR